MYMSHLISTVVFLLLVNTVIGLRQLQGDDGDPLVEAFVCDSDLYKIDPVINKGDAIKICIKTRVRAKVQGISIAKMIDFYLSRKETEMEQTLLQNGVTASSNEHLTCQPGASLCILESIPGDAFFGRDGRVSAIGSVLLQYDDELDTNMPTVAPTISPTMAPTFFNATETTFPSSAPNNETVVTPQHYAHRQQLSLDPTRVIIETSFTVATAGKGTGILVDFREHWDAAPTYVRVLYVFAFIFFFLILFGLGLGCLLWAGFCGNVRELVPESLHAAKDDPTMDESMGAFSPFARNKEGVVDQYDDEPMPRQISIHRRTDIEAPGDQVNVARKRQPRTPRTAGGRSIRDRHVAQKARLSRHSINPNRDLAASFLHKFPRKKVASVRAKTPRSVDNRRPTIRTNDSLPREKTASSVRWLHEKNQLQRESAHSASFAPRRNSSLQSNERHARPLRGGIVLHGNSIPKPAQKPNPPIPPPPTKPTFEIPIVETVYSDSSDDDESSQDSSTVDVESPQEMTSNMTHGTIDNPRPID